MQEAGHLSSVHEEIGSGDRWLLRRNLLAAVVGPKGCICSDTLGRFAGWDSSLSTRYLSAEQELSPLEISSGS